MPELKYNTTQYEIFYLKNRRLFIIVAIIATIILIALTFWFLQSFGFINNNDLKEVKYSVENIEANDKYSVLTNHELIQYKEGGLAKINVKNNTNSTVALVDDKSNIVAINETYNSSFKFSNVSSFVTLISNSPYYIFLDNDSKKLLRTELEKKDYTLLNTKLTGTSLSKVIQTQEYLDLLNLTNKDLAINKIVKKLKQRKKRNAIWIRFKAQVRKASERKG